VDAGIGVELTTRLLEGLLGGQGFGLSLGKRRLGFIGADDAAQPAW